MGSLPLVSQGEVLFGVIIALICLVAFGATTFLILALSKILDLLPIDFGVAEYLDENRSDENGE